MLHVQVIRQNQPDLPAGGHFSSATGEKSRPARNLNMQGLLSIAGYRPRGKTA